MSAVLAGIWSALVVVGVSIALVVAPIWLVWPRAWARLTPPPLRRAVVARPALATAAVAVPISVLVSVVMCRLVFTTADPGRSLVSKAFAVLLLVGIFGGMTAAAVVRLLRVGAAEWVLRQPPRVVRRAPAPTGNGSTGVPAWPAIDWTSHSRPDGDRADRLLRSAAVWLVAAGVAWYLFGRALQFTRQRSDAPGWWWAVTGVLVACGAVVWATRRIRWRWQGRSHSDRAIGRALETIADELGLTTYRPGGEWVRRWAPAAFLPQSAVTGPSLWPWAATGTVAETPILLAVQRGQVRNRTGLTSTHVRTACAARLANARLPHVVIAGRDSVPPTERGRAVALELEAFNRAMWAWGPDASGVYAILHPRAMQHVLRHLPDGSRALFGGNTVVAFTDEPTSPAQLRGLVQFVESAVRLLPSYVASPSR